MSRSFLIIILFLAGFTSFAQSPKSVVNLTNGVKLKGNILEYIQGDYMIMQITDAQNLRIPYDYILSFKIKQKEIISSSYIKRKRTSSFSLPQRGYFNYTSAGLLFLKEYGYEWAEIKPVVHMVNGYRFNEKYAAGIGLGLDNYEHAAALPMYLTIRRDLFPLKATPVLNANLGYSWMWGNDSYYNWNEFRRVEGGLYWELGVGIRMNLRNTALILNYAYKNQNSVFTQKNNVWWNVSNVQVENHQFRNMTLTLGVEF